MYIIHYYSSTVTPLTSKTNRARAGKSEYKSSCRSFALLYLFFLSLAVDRNANYRQTKDFTMTLESHNQYQMNF